MKKTIIRSIAVAIGVSLWQLTASSTVQAEDARPATDTSANSQVEPLPAPSIAVVLSTRGTCDYSTNGVRFGKLYTRHLLTQGAVIRTGEKSRVDIFFRGIGTTVRLQPNTEVKLERMFHSVLGGVPLEDTCLALHSGRIFTVVRSLVAGSTFEIRNAAGRSVVEGAPSGVVGRYIITADGAQVADKSSVLPIKLIGEKGITIISPGEKFDVKQGKMMAIATPGNEETLIELDELHAITEEEFGKTKSN